MFVKRLKKCILIHYGKVHIIMAISVNKVKCWLCSLIYFMIVLQYIQVLKFSSLKPHDFVKRKRVLFCLISIKNSLLLKGKNFRIILTKLAFLWFYGGSRTLTCFMSQSWSKLSFSYRIFCRSILWNSLNFRVWFLSLNLWKLFSLFYFWLVLSSWSGVSWLTKTQSILKAFLWIWINLLEVDQARL